MTRVLSNLHFLEINHSENFHKYLTYSIPLVSLSITILENEQPNKIQSNFGNVMYYVSKNYEKTLGMYFYDYIQTSDCLIFLYSFNPHIMLLQRNCFCISIMMMKLLIIHFSQFSKDVPN